MKFLTITLVSASMISLLSAAGQGRELVYFGNVSMSSGDYWHAGNTTSMLWESGLEYRSERLTLAVSIPFIGQNTDAVAYNSIGLMPNGRAWRQDSDEEDDHGHGMFGFEMHHEMDFGLGDVYLNGTYLILSASNLPRVGVGFLAKIPVGNQRLGYSTGSYDYGVKAILSKDFGVRELAMELSYLHLGNTQAFEFESPLIFSTSIKRRLLKNRFNVKIFYAGSTTIIQGMDPVRQTGVDVDFPIIDRSKMIVGLTAGLSDIVPDFTYLMSIEANL